MDKSENWLTLILTTLAFALGRATANGDDLYWFALPAFLCFTAAIWRNVTRGILTTGTPEIELPTPMAQPRIVLNRDGKKTYLDEGAFETKICTKSTLGLSWYLPPCPIRQAQSYASALMLNDFEWIDERHLIDYRANISQSHYRKLRRDWINRDWCDEVGNKTYVVNKSMIRRVAVDIPVTTHLPR